MTTSIADLSAEIYTITNRPDLIAETTSAVKSATLKAHQQDYFDRDLFETGIVFDFSDFTQSFAFQQFIPQWRALKYIRKYDPNAAPLISATGPVITKDEFDIVTPDSAFDSYNLAKVDVVYLAGQQLQLKSSTSFKYVLLGCYVNPNITTTGYASWIADQYRYCIIYEACRIIFKMIGKDAEATMYEALTKEQWAILAINNIQLLGY